MAGEGRLLQEAREKNGWSYKDVEDHIKIRVRYLEALENEQYEILPGITYTRGFLRTYSKHLDLNPEQIIDLYNTSLQPESAPEVHPPLTPIQSTPVWFKPIVIIVMGLFAVAIVIGITFLSRMNENPEVSGYNPAPLPTAPQTQAPSDQEQNDVQQQPPAQQEEQAPTIYEGVVAELTFKEDCWLRVRVDGGPIEEGTNAAGTTKVLQGTQKIEFLTIGNAGGVAIKLNGKEVSPLGASREAVWNYIVTEETIRDL